MRVFTYSFALILSAINVLGSVKSYHPCEDLIPSSEWIFQSTEYAVEVEQTGIVTPCFTYMTKSQHSTNRAKTNSWTSFEFDDGPVTVRITKMEGEINHCAVLPSSKEIEVRRGDGFVEFEIKEPGQFAVDFQTGAAVDHAMMVFANAPETSIPDKNDPNVIWFEAGVHELGANYEISSNKTIYLEPEAYVKGRFVSNGAENINIRGRGIISGELFPVRSAGFLVHMRKTNNILIEGVTVVHAPSHNVVMSGSDHVVRNVKVMGWHFSTDGIKTGENSVIEDCFIKTNDDSIRLYDSHTIARRNVIWQMENGAAFQIGWSSDNNGRHFHAYDNDVIRVEHLFDNENESVFCAINGSGGTRSDYLFEDIRVENCKWRIFRIVTLPNRWASWNPEKGGVSDVVFKNIKISGKQRLRSIIKGHDPKHLVQNIIFENVEMDGKIIQSLEDGNIFVDPKTTKNVRVFAH